MLSVSSAPHPYSWFNNCFLWLSRDSRSGLEWGARGGGVSSHPLTSIHSRLLILTP